MADHCIYVPIITSVGHDKTSTDIGSTWTDGINQYVLAGISGNNLTFYPMPSGSPWSMNLGGALSSPLTYVSGGVHASNITITSQSNSQSAACPNVKNIIDQILVNGTTPVTGGASGYANYVDMSEEFDVIDPSTINTKNNPFVWNDANIWMHVKNVYHATAGTTVVHSTYTVERPMSVGYFGVIQVGAITAPSYQNQYY